MGLIVRWLRKRLFGISPEEVTFARRGFRGGDAGVRQRLEQVGHTFLEGYHAAIASDDPNELALRLNRVDLEFRGLAFEGAAMGLTLLDALTPWNTHRLHTFLDGPGAAHVYMVHVGAGWAFARLPWLRRNVDRPMTRLDPLLRWLAIDGYGFHEGYFYGPKFIKGQAVPKSLNGYARRAFDQGLGRSLWFVNGADVTQIPKTIRMFLPATHADLWGGVGLAGAYAGGVDRSALEKLQCAAGAYRSHLAQGAAFAAKARQRAGNPAAHTALACEILCGMSADAAAAITDSAMQNLPTTGPDPAYEVWRTRIRTRFDTEGQCLKGSGFTVQG